MNLPHLSPSVIELSRQAGAAIREVYSRDDYAVQHKADQSPLTAADLAAHDIIVEGLGKLTPGVPVLSEESVSIGWDVRQQWSRYWLVDPLDGTREFIKGNGEFTVNIALIESGVPVLGVVYGPALDLLYWGGRELGAWKETAGQRQAIRTAKIQPGQRSLRIVASRTHRGPKLEAWLANTQKTFPEQELVSMGSSLKICLVAEAVADIYPRLALTSEWDTAAAQAVLEAAGGKLVDANYREYRYNRKADLLNPFFFAIGDRDYDFAALQSGEE